MPDSRARVIPSATLAITALGWCLSLLLVIVWIPARAAAQSGGLPFGNIDLVRPVPGGVDVAGWVVDPDSPTSTQVHVYDGRIGLVALNANQARPDVAAAVPTAGGNRGFSGRIPLGVGEHNVCLYAINIGGGSNPLLGCRLVGVAAPFGRVDSAAQVPNGIRFAGWALDPDSTDPLDVVVEVAGVQRTTVRADRSRPDLGALYPWAGNDHGFEATLPLPPTPGSYRACVYALNIGEGPTFTTLACTNVVVSNRPIGVVDAVRVGTAIVRVSGWALDPDTAAPIQVGAAIQNVGNFFARADQHRPDVGAAYGGYGTGHGFSFDVAVPNGVRTVCVSAMGVGAGGDTPLACRAIDPAPAGSGAGRRIVYGNLAQKVWLVDDDGLVARSYLISGRYQDPPPGLYRIYGWSRYADAGHDGITMEYFVAFWPDGLGYGFHTIPVDADGVPLQSEDELGDFRSAGCVRQTRVDAIFLWNWSRLNDAVVVLR